MDADANGSGSCQINYFYTTNVIRKSKNEFINNKIGRYIHIIDI